MAPLRLGIAGAGIAALQALPNIAKISDKIHLTALADVRRDNMDFIASQYDGDIRQFDSVEAMCATDVVDAIWIATPNNLHAEHTIVAANAGKHIVCEKPMAVSLDQCRAMVDAVETNGVKYVQGHSKVYDTPIRKIGELLQTGSLGRVTHIHTWNWNDWLLRALTPDEVDTAQGTGVVFRQGPHQVDIVRFLGGGMVRSVRATAGRWQPGFPDCEGNYTAFVDFENGTAATIVFDGYGYFDVGELTWGIGESGRRLKNPDSLLPRERPAGPIPPDEKYDLVRSGNWYGYGSGGGIDPTSPLGPPFFGLSVVNCERGVIRQSPSGIYVYDANGRREIPCDAHHGRSGELLELYDAVTRDRPTLLDARWGMATAEVCLAILQSSAERREIMLSHQTLAPEVKALGVR